MLYRKVLPPVVGIYTKRAIFECIEVLKWYRAEMHVAYPLSKNVEIKLGNFKHFFKIKLFDSFKKSNIFFYIYYQKLTFSSKKNLTI